MIFQALHIDVDEEWNAIDGTAIRAHQHSSGGKGAEKNDIGVSRGGRTTKIHTRVDAAGSGYLEVAQYLLGLGIGNLYGDLPLTCAVMSGNLELVKLLLDAGADRNQGNKGFENALDIALRDGHDDIADCLRSHGAQPGVCVPRVVLAQGRYVIGNVDVSRQVHWLS